MPRYPNLWICVHEGLAIRGSYHHAVRFLLQLLEDGVGLRNSFAPDVVDPSLRATFIRPGEGADYQARIFPMPAAAGHLHQVHARFYWSSVYAAGASKWAEWLRIPASVHYEVATDEPSHPYADDCPLCGITGEYELPIDRETQDYCVRIHDPLGLEAMLYGRVRGRRVADAVFGSMRHLAGLAATLSVRIEEQFPESRECTRIAIVYLQEYDD
jgi:hypothetical protein